MFKFFKNKKSTEIVVVDKDTDENGDSVALGAGFATIESASVSTQATAQKFAKPEKYDRSVLDDNMAKRNIKAEAFQSGVTVKDSYTGDVLTLTKAETDHKISLQQRYEQTKDNPWLTSDDVKASSNSSDNLEVVSRKFNNAKRSRSNTEFVTDDEYLQRRCWIIRAR